LVPVSVTVAKGTGAPESSFTVPVIVRVWANANTPQSISNTNKVRNFLMCEIVYKKFYNSGKYMELIEKCNKKLINANLTIICLKYDKLHYQFAACPNQLIPKY
jgi:hypothetical protein